MLIRAMRLILTKALTVPRITIAATMTIKGAVKMDRFRKYIPHLSTSSTFTDSQYSEKHKLMPKAPGFIGKIP